MKQPPEIFRLRSTICFKCKKNPRHEGGSYCLECRRAKTAAWAAKRKSQSKSEG